jgi:hypothetical protein
MTCLRDGVSPRGGASGDGPADFAMRGTQLLVQQPPGANNFCIGCVGTILTQARPGTSSPLLPNGEYDSYGTPVTPSSLYLEQLCERLGPDALGRIGYGGTSATPVARGR